MASLGIGFGAAAAGAMNGRVFAATTAAKNSGEKGPFDWILGGMQKEDQLLETDPVLQKVEGKTNGSKKSTTTSVSVPSSKKSGGFFGDLFAKK